MSAPTNGPANGPTGDLRLLPDDVEDDLRATLDRLLAARCTPGAVAAAYDGDDGLAADLWPALVELGLPALLVPEEHGGAGASAREAAAVLDVLARHAAPVPYLSSAVVATTVLDRLDAGEQLARLADGAVAALLVPATTHRADDVAPLVRHDDGTLSGSVRSVVGVAGGTPAGLLLAPVAGPDGPALAVLDAGATGVRVEPVVSLDMTAPLADVRLDGAAATLLPGDARAAVDAGLRAGAALAASALAGTASWALATTVSYLLQRRQFGRVVGGFQALKHRLADLYAEVEQATATARYAAAALAADDPDLPVATAVAKSRCSEVAVHATEEAVQLHGGIAMTWEHPCHLHLKRARAGSLVLGPPAAHRDDLAVLVDLPPPAPDPRGSTTWT